MLAFNFPPEFASQGDFRKANLKLIPQSRQEFQHTTDRVLAWLDRTYSGWDARNRDWMRLQSYLTVWVTQVTLHRNSIFNPDVCITEFLEYGGCIGTLGEDWT